MDVPTYLVSDGEQEQVRQWVPDEFRLRLDHLDGLKHLVPDA